MNQGYGNLSQPDPQFMHNPNPYMNQGHGMSWANPYNPYQTTGTIEYYPDQPQGGGDSIVPPPPMVQASNGEMVPKKKKHRKRKKDRHGHKKHRKRKKNKDDNPEKRGRSRP